MSRAEVNLDRLLADMAEDVPPVPADFHNKWMNAVRAEATQAEEPAEAPVIPVSPVSQWPRFLSIAAVFVFLIGGTFIYRSARKPNQPESRPANPANVTETVETDEIATAGTAMEKAADYAGETGPWMDSAGETGYAAVNSAEEGPMMNTAEEITASKTAGKAAEAPVATMTIDSAGEAAYEAAVMEEAEEIGEAEPLLNMSTEIIVTEAPATATPVPTPAAREGIAGFFADMGDFLLAVWPYLLVVLVLLAIAAVVNKTRKK